MAFSNSLLERTTFGNKSVAFYSCVADAATGSVNTGFSVVDHISYAPKSMTTAAAKFTKNAGPVGTSLAGYIAVTGVANGDEFYLTVYGR